MHPVHVHVGTSVLHGGARVSVVLRHPVVQCTGSVLRGRTYDGVGGGGRKESGVELGQQSMGSIGVSGVEWGGGGWLVVCCG